MIGRVINATSCYRLPFPDIAPSGGASDDNFRCARSRCSNARSTRSVATRDMHQRRSSQQERNLPDRTFVSELTGSFSSHTIAGERHVPGKHCMAFAEYDTHCIFESHLIDQSDRCMIAHLLSVNRSSVFVIVNVTMTGYVLFVDV